MIAMTTRNCSVVLLLASLLIGCGSDESAQPDRPGPSLAMRYEDYCAPPGLSVPLRDTFVVIDESVIVHAASPEEFASKNSYMRDAVMSLANYQDALEQGRTAPRERISVFVAGSDGSPARQIFTGCIPGLSEKERKEIAAGQSASSRFFSGRAEEAFIDGANEFTAILAGALINAARRAPEEPTGTKMFQSIRNFGSLLGGTENARRIILVSNRVQVETAETVTETRTVAFRNASETNIDFANSDVYLLATGGENPLAVSYMEAWLIAQNGRLAGWAAEPSGLIHQTPPTTLLRYAGTTTYPDGQALVIKIRLAWDENGRLVDSWLVLTDLRDHAIPMSGQAICRLQNDCEIRSDRGGFAQAWIAEKGSEPVFDNQVPFAGLREWKLTLTGDALRGEVFDSAVDVIVGSNRKFIPLQATHQVKATF